MIKVYRCIVTLSTLTSIASLTEKALCEGGDKADFDDQADHRFQGSQHGNRVIQRNAAIYPLTT
jgi:hypothetical protein